MVDYLDVGLTLNNHRIPTHSVQSNASNNMTSKLECDIIYNLSLLTPARVILET